MSKRKDAEGGKRKPSKREQRAIDSAAEAYKQRPVRPQYNEAPAGDGTLKLVAQHTDEMGHSTLVTDTFATSSGDFVGAALLQLAQITTRGKKPSVEGLNASLALIGAVKPQDEFEAALAVQMAATHELSMEMLRRTKTADLLEPMKDYGNLATKLQRTFTAQMKALSDWRRGGEQLVRHVHVYEGGQAVVAETVNVGGPNEKLAFKPHEQGALIASVPCAHPEGHPLPVSGDQGAESLPVTRRTDKKRRRTSGK